MQLYTRKRLQIAGTTRDYQIWAGLKSLSLDGARNSCTGGNNPGVKMIIIIKAVPALDVHLLGSRNSVLGIFGLLLEAIDLSIRLCQLRLQSGSFVCRRRR